MRRTSTLLKTLSRAAAEHSPLYKATIPILAMAEGGGGEFSLVHFAQVVN